MTSEKTDCFSFDGKTLRPQMRDTDLKNVENEDSEKDEVFEKADGKSVEGEKMVDGKSEDEGEEEYKCSPCGDFGDGRKMRKMLNPCLPTRAEIDEHELTHLPFRNWCEHCVKGRGRPF